MKAKRFDISPGIEAAALRFAKACKRDGYGDDLCALHVFEGRVRYVHLYKKDGADHFLIHEGGEWYELSDIPQRADEGVA